MKVKELIEELEKHDPDHDVYIDVGSYAQDDDASICCIEKVYEGSLWNIIIKL